MKTIYKYTIFIFISTFLFSACENEETEDVSQITYYAKFDMSGGQYLLWQQGTPYEEPGVTASEDGEPLEVEISGTVDENTPGVYPITYSAVNSDGFPATTTRFVAVGDVQTASSRDLSGLYLEVGGGENEVTKIADGFYMNSDILPPNGIQVFMADLGNGMLIIPTQGSPYGPVTADPSIDPESSATLISETTFEVNLRITGYPIFPRTFVKQ